MNNIKFTLAGYYKATPKIFRIIGDAILGFVLLLNSILLYAQDLIPQIQFTSPNQKTEVMFIIGAIGIILKYISNFAHQPTLNEKAAEK